MRTPATLFAAVIFSASIASALAEVHYVDVNGTNATPPYTNWTTAAANIQDAVDAAATGDEIVVTNGSYAPVLVAKSLALRSVNGPRSTTIDGRGGVFRCAELTNGASLSGFTLTHGWGPQGGGVFCESTAAVVANCVIAGNSAYFDGGGASGGTLNNCALSGNSSGAASRCALNNCTLIGNSGGGASGREP